MELKCQNKILKMCFKMAANHLTCTHKLIELDMTVLVPVLVLAVLDSKCL